MKTEFTQNSSGQKQFRLETSAEEFQNLVGPIPEQNRKTVTKIGPDDSGQEISLYRDGGKTLQVRVKIDVEKNPALGFGDTSVQNSGHRRPVNIVGTLSPDQKTVTLTSGFRGTTLLNTTENGFQDTLNRLGEAKNNGHLLTPDDLSM